MSVFEGSIPVELKYQGAETDEHLISLYDLSQALYGFERSLALTTHLILYDEVITQATSLKGARIYSRPPKEGSFSVIAVITLLAGATYKVTTLKPDNPLGHLVHSAYDFLVHKVTGQKLDYEKSIRELYKEKNIESRFGLKMPSESRFNSLAEKIEPPLTRMHRPIIKSGTAEAASVSFTDADPNQTNVIRFDRDSFSGMKYRSRLDEIQKIEAKVSVFNPNTFNGRLFIPDEQRTIPFYLTPAGRSAEAFDLIGQSYSINLNDRESDLSLLSFDVLKTVSRLGNLTKLSVIKVRPKEPQTFDDEDLIDDADF